MRIAVAGKGGAGKTTLAATMARLAARRGIPVVAVDADSNPNLGVALGLPPSPAPVPALSARFVSRRLDRPGLALPLERVLGEVAVPAPDGVRLVAMGGPAHAEEGCLCSAHGVVSALLGALGEEPGMLAVVDLEASPEHLGRGTARHADTLVLVAEPYYRALEAVGRMARLAAELPIGRVAVVANKVRRPDDEHAIVEYCARHSLGYVGAVPWHDAVLAADRDRRPLPEDERAAPVVAACAGLLDRLLAAP